MDAHAREYAAAVQGMAQTYGPAHQGRTRLLEGRLVTTWAAGDWVTFRADDGETRMGVVVEVLVEDAEFSQYHIAAHIPGEGRKHFCVYNRDILIF
jgi:uncharacterized protein YijF (DUF1287 family)